MIMHLNTLTAMIIVIIIKLMFHKTERKKGYRLYSSIAYYTSLKVYDESLKVSSSHVFTLTIPTYLKTSVTLMCRV